MMGQNPNPLQAYTQGISAADAVNQINQKQAYQDFISQSGEALYQGDEAALQRYAAFDPEGAFALRGQFEQRAAQQASRARAGAAATAKAEQDEQFGQIRNTLAIMDTAFNAGPEKFAEVAAANGLTEMLTEYNAGFDNYQAASAGLRERVGSPAQVMPEPVEIKTSKDVEGRLRYETGPQQGELVYPQAEATSTDDREMTKLADGFYYWDDSITDGSPERVAPDVEMKSGTPLVSMTGGEKEVDKQFATTYLEWTQGGGADVIGNAAQIGVVLDALEAGKPLTGSTAQIMGAPDFYMALTDPEALDARERVEEVVQRNLRVILGAQFTENEGKRLIARAFNPKLTPEVNASRLRKLFKQMEIAATQKEEMATYYEDNSFSLSGYRGTRPTIQSFYDAIGGDAQEPSTPAPTYPIELQSMSTDDISGMTLDQFGTVDLSGVQLSPEQWDALEEAAKGWK